MQEKFGSTLNFLKNFNLPLLTMFRDDHIREILQMELVLSSYLANQCKSRNELILAGVSCVSSSGLS